MSQLSRKKVINNEKKLTPLIAHKIQKTCGFCKLLGKKYIKYICLCARIPNSTPKKAAIIFPIFMQLFY